MSGDPVTIVRGPDTLNREEASVIGEERGAGIAGNRAPTKVQKSSS